MDAGGEATAGSETGGGTWRFAANKPLRLDSGATLSPLEVAYKTYGRLNEAKTNAVLVCHALTGDQHAGSVNPVTGRPGWWDSVIGPGLPLDPERYFIIATNVVG
ncbi:MAG: homoserine O-acetyltransferase, partial [Phenylobacterium sp.]